MAITIDPRDLDEMLKMGVLQPHAAIGAPTAPSIQQAQGAPGLPVSTPPPPDLQKPTRKESNAAGRAEFEMGKPTVTAEPGLPGFYQQKEEQNQYAKEHPWGSPVSAHPGFLGKVGHALATAGNIAGDIFVPHVMENIPGTQLNRQEQSTENEAGFEKAQQGQTAKEAVEERPEIAEESGELRGQLQAERDAAADKRLGETIQGQNQRATEGNQSKENVATGTNQSREKIAEAGNTTKETIAAGANVSREKVAQLANESRQLIAQEHEAGANQRAAISQDPNKLTNAMKTMKQTAQATLPELDSALDETDKVAGMLGPTAGRWNDFWQGKVGAGDPAFAHYKDEIAFISTAVTLAHARGRMSNELFEHFQQMFDAGKQDAANMKEALGVAKEWLGGYANLGEGTPTGNAAAPGAPPPGAKIRDYTNLK